MEGGSLLIRHVPKYESKSKKISGSNSVGYEEFYVLRHNVLWNVDNGAMFRRNISPLFSGSNNKRGKKKTGFEQYSGFC